MGVGVSWCVVYRRRRNMGSQVPETGKHHSSGIPETRFSLQAKLTLAFVLVSLIGFVVAFLVLPRIYVQSKEKEIERSEPENVLLLRSFFDGMTKEEDKVYREVGEMIAQLLRDEEEFDLRGVTLTEPVSPAELMEKMNESDPSTGRENLKKRFEITCPAVI